jgi:hypothetical protein
MSSLGPLKINPDGPWNIIKVGNDGDGKNHTIINEDLSVVYPKGSYKPSAKPKGGIGFYAAPETVFPCQEVNLSYKFKFGSNFDPVKGGKLPGLYIGEPGASGGKHATDKASARLMWRTANSDGTIAAEAYVYCAEKQVESYDKLPGIVRNPKYGDSLWRNELKFTKDKENEVLLSIRVNTFKDGKAQSDGSIRMVVNGVYRVFDEIKFVESVADLEGITFDTFFGGGSEDYATPESTIITFRDFRLTRDSVVDYVKPTEPTQTSFPTPTILSLVSIAENASLDPEWNYAENIKDGRGITFCIVGFCTGTGDGAKCMAEYIKIETDKNEIDKATGYMVAMQKATKLGKGKGRDTMEGLDGFIEWFNRIGVTKPMMQAAMNVIQKSYWYPALKYMGDKGMLCPLSAYIAYDTLLNFGQMD